MLHLVASAKFYCFKQALSIEELTHSLHLAKHFFWRFGTPLLEGCTIYGGESITAKNKLWGARKPMAKKAGGSFFTLLLGRKDGRRHTDPERTRQVH